MSYINDYTETAIKGRQNFAYRIDKYKREELNCGITEVSYEINFSYTLHGVLLLPSFGISAISSTITEGLNRGLGHNYHVHYFDSETGLLLSEKRNEVDQAANTQGLNCVSQDKYDLALCWFQKAFKWLEVQYQEHPYNNNIKSITVGIEALKYFHQKDYVKACEKFKEAHDTSKVEFMYKHFAAKMQRCFELANPEEKQVVQKIINMENLKIGTLVQNIKQ